MNLRKSVSQTNIIAKLGLASSSIEIQRIGVYW